MQNEPDYANVNYESCQSTPQQMDNRVASLTASGANTPLTAKLIMPESSQDIQAQSDPTLADPNAVGNVAIIGEHLYSATPKYYTTAENDGKDVWMTEHALSPSGSQPAIGDALALAEEVHNTLVVGQWNAYVYWWIWNDPNDGVNYGLINSNTSSQSLTFTLDNGSVTSLTPNQTTSSSGLAAQSAVIVSGGQLSYMLPAQSIVRFYQ